VFKTYVLTDMESQLMPLEKPALLKESVSLRKSNDGAILRGEFELYDDRLVLRISQRFSLSSLARPLPPTFPGVEMRESIPFSRITSISGRIKKAVISRRVKVDMRTDEGVTWGIEGPVRILDALQKAYQVRKQRGHQ